MFNKKVWIDGETKAKNFLQAQGYKILETNYKNKVGEIDIICLSQDDEYIFVEVKARSSESFGLPREAVNYFKQNKIRQVATSYLKKNHLLETKIRFDVIEIIGEKIEHIKYAF